MADDDVQLTDLEVIQQFSLAVRGATASRAEVLAALEADLAFLTGSGGRRRAPAPAVTRGQVLPAAPDEAPVKPAVAAPARTGAAAAKVRPAAAKVRATAPAKTVVPASAKLLPTAKVTRGAKATPAAAKAPAKKAVKAPAKKATRGRSA